MYRRYVNLISSQIHRLFSLDISSFSNPRRIAELSIVKLNQNSVKFNVLQSLDDLFIDKSGQVSAELISTPEIILRILRGNSIPFCCVLIIFTLDHTKLAPVKGKPFPGMIPHFKLLLNVNITKLCPHMQ